MCGIRSKAYTLREAKLILRNRALKKTIATLRDQLSTMRSAFIDVQQMIRNNDKDAEIERLNATIDRTVNAWESRCIEKYDEIKRLNIVIDELIKKGFTYNRQQWSELVHRIQKEREQ